MSRLRTLCGARVADCVLGKKRQNKDLYHKLRRRRDLETMKWVRMQVWGANWPRKQSSEDDKVLQLATVPAINIIFLRPNDIIDITYYGSLIMKLMTYLRTHLFFWPSFVYFIAPVKWDSSMGKGTIFARGFISPNVQSRMERGDVEIAKRRARG